jgi:acyl carrier protein
MHTMTIDTFIEHIEDNIEGVEPGSVNADTVLKELPIWDSLAMLNMLALVDSEYDVQISGEELNQLSSVQSIFEAIQSKRGQ